MKKFILIISCLILITPTSAEEVLNPFVPQHEEFDIKGKVEYDENGVVILDNDIEQKEIILSLPKSVKAHSMDEIKTIDHSLIEKYRKISQMNSTIWNDTIREGKTNHKRGPLTYGVYYENEIDEGQMEYRTNFYSRYDNDKFALTTVYGQNQYTTTGNQLNFFYLSPEVKLGKGFVLKDTLRTSNTGRRKNEIILQYNTKTKRLDNNLNFQVGFAQSVYENSNCYYQLKFATSFQL